jgi:hypothetical protein
MSIEQDVYALLSNRAQIVAHVGDRIYPYAIPQGVPMPAIAYVRTGTTAVSTLDGVPNLQQARIAIAAWGTGIEQAEQVADAVVGALAAAGVPVSDRMGTYDGDLGFYGVTVECDWWNG